MAPRIGTFLFFFGVCLIVLFILTDLASQPNFAYFLLGAVAIITGGVLWWRTPSGEAPPPPPGRFRMLKNLSNRAKPKKK
jgi:drug/metabolite transporter (DMT)-like permease